MTKNKAGRTSFHRTSALILALVLLSACATSSGVPNVFGRQARVSTIDEATASRVRTSLTSADYKRLAETVTNKMLAAPHAQAWAVERPVFIVGVTANNTDDENIRIGDVYDGIQERLLNSGLVRVAGESATNFDYVIRPEMTSTQQTDADGNQLKFYTLRIKLYTLGDELIGQWSDNLAFARTEKPFFGF